MAIKKIDPQVKTATGYDELRFRAYNSDALNGKSDTAFATSEQGTKADNALPKTGTAVNSQKLNNKSENQLSVAYAETAANSQKLNNKLESQLSVYYASSANTANSANMSVFAQFFDTPAVSNLNYIADRSYIMRFNAGTTGAPSQSVGGVVWQGYHEVIDYYYQLCVQSDTISVRYKPTGEFWTDWRSI